MTTDTTETTEKTPPTQPDAGVPAEYGRLADPFGAVVERVPDGAWSASSPCEGWTAADVLDHVVGTQRDFLTQRGVLDDPPTDEADTGPARRWRAHDDLVRGLLADPGVAGREYDGVFGRATVGASMLAFYGFDLVVHRWDIATAAGLEAHLTPDEVALLDRAADGFGEHLYDDGVCRPALDVPPDATAEQRVLARLGRRA
jgi:uncharacterized protein (TIGR03086 family)